MNPWPLSFRLTTPPPSHAPLHPIFYSALTSVVPLIVLSIIVRSLQPSTAHLFTPAGNTTIDIEALPQTFHHISAVHPLPSGLIVADHPTNSLFFLPREGRLSHPFLENAGGTNESHSVKLRRPGISALAEYSSSDDITLLIVARHAARGIALLPIAHHRPFPSSGQPITLADSFNGTRLNSPNSLHVDSEGNISFSDAYFGLIEEADEFDRKLDDPPAKTHSQCVYYLPADEVQCAIEGKRTLEPRLLVSEIDRPTGIAVYGDRLFVSVASPRNPGVVEFLLADTENTLRARDPAELYEWAGALHSWGQRSFSGILGNLLIADGILFVGAGDGVAVFDISLRNSGKKVLAWVGVAIPPGPPTVAFKDGWLFVGASQRVLKIRIV